MAGGKANLESSLAAAWAAVGMVGVLVDREAGRLQISSATSFCVCWDRELKREVVGDGPQKVSSSIYLWPFGLFLPLILCTAGETRDPRVPTTAVKLSVLL